MVLWRLVRCGGQFWAKGGYTLEHHEGRTSYGCKTNLEGKFYHSGHHGITGLDKCHYNFLVPLLWLQFSSIERNLSIP